MFWHPDHFSDRLLLVVVHDLNVTGTPLGPRGTDPILLVDPDTMLAPSIPREQLKPVPGRNPQLIELLNGVELIQFAHSHAPKPTRAGRSSLLGSPAIEDVFRAFIPERLNHAAMIARLPCYVELSIGER